MKKKAPVSLVKLMLLVALLQLLEVILIIAGIIPPIFSYSPVNLLFYFALLAVLIYMGLAFAKQGLKSVAAKGAAVSFVALFVQCVASLAGKQYFNITILGLLFTNTLSLFLTLALIIASNVLVGSIVAVSAAWVKRKMS